MLTKTKWSTYFGRREDKKAKYCIPEFRSQDKEKLERGERGREGRGGRGGEGGRGRRGGEGGREGGELQRLVTS